MFVILVVWCCFVFSSFLSIEKVIIYGKNVNTYTCIISTVVFVLRVVLLLLETDRKLIRVVTFC